MKLIRWIRRWFRQAEAAPPAGTVVARAAREEAMGPYPNRPIRGNADRRFRSRPVRGNAALLPVIDYQIREMP